MITLQLFITVLLLYSCQVYSWGYGDMLALGHGKDADELTPRVRRTIIMSYSMIVLKLYIILLIYFRD
jgi:hypothetical protein